MTNNLTLKNEQVAAYLATKNSLIALEKAVDNGQTRLSLQVLVDIVDELFERIVALEELSLGNREEEVATKEEVVSTAVETAPVEQKKATSTEKQEDETSSVKAESGKSTK